MFPVLGDSQKATNCHGKFTDISLCLFGTLLRIKFSCQPFPIYTSSFVLVFQLLHFACYFAFHQTPVCRYFNDYYCRNYM